jgi:hypothetical protein
MKNGSAMAAAIRSPAKGGPTKLFNTVSAPHKRPLAFSSWLLCTIDGMSVCAELSRTTSAEPSRSAVT